MFKLVRACRTYHRGKMDFVPGSRRQM
jgi:hypothetical protein